MAVVNLNSGLTGQDSGGTWNNGKCDSASPNSIDISDPTNVTIPDSPTAIYWFNYFVGSGDCTDCAEVNVNIYDGTYSIGVAENIEVCTTDLASFDLEAAIYGWTTPPDTDDIVPEWDLFIEFPSSDCPIIPAPINANIVGAGQINITQADMLNMSNCNVGDVTNVSLIGRYRFPDGSDCESTVPFTMTVIDCNPCCELNTTTSPGFISLGNVTCGGTLLTDFVIEWRDDSNNLIFTSGGGSFYDASTMYDHPTNNIPVPSGNITATFTQGSTEPPCTNVFNVPLISCTTGVSTNYSGGGGIQAETTQTMEVDSTVDNINVCIRTLTASDGFKLTYNGVVIYDSGLLVTGTQLDCFNIPFNYISGQNELDITVYNNNPSLNTQYSLTAKCCSALPCSEYVFQTPVVSANLNSNCGCSINVTSPVNFDYAQDCMDVQSLFNSRTVNVGGCDTNTTNVLTTCTNTNLTFTKTGNIVTWNFGTASGYAEVKSLLQAAHTNNEYTSIFFRNQICGADGDQVQLRIFPQHFIINYNDTTFNIELTLVANPYTDTCTGCESVLFDRFSAILNTFNTSNNIIYTNTWLSVEFARKEEVVTNPVSNQFITHILSSNECGDLSTAYSLQFLDDDCPCQSWELYTGGNLIQTAPGWNGTCQ